MKLQHVRLPFRLNREPMNLHICISTSLGKRRVFSSSSFKSVVKVYKKVKSHFNC